MAFTHISIAGEGKIAVVLLVSGHEEQPLGEGWVKESRQMNTQSPVRRRTNIQQWEVPFTEGTIAFLHQNLMLLWQVITKYLPIGFIKKNNWIRKFGPGSIRDLSDPNLQPTKRGSNQKEKERERKHDNYSKFQSD